jgi:lactoylglutathione lyase
MRIEHVAIYTRDLESLRSFYTYFHAISGALYVNERKGFCSYFLSFADGARLELMQMESIPDSLNDPVAQFTGIIHIAFALGSKSAVDRMSKPLRDDGFRMLDAPRQTGDGYYECTFLDPDGNRIEITE